MSKRMFGIFFIFFLLFWGIGGVFSAEFNDSGVGGGMVSPTVVSSSKVSKDLGKSGVAEGYVEVYRKGYNDGYYRGKLDGYVDGYRQAVEDFKKIFRAKLKEYKAIEAGKFLVKNWYISYPRVFQVQKGNRVELLIEGCRVMKPVDNLASYVEIPFLDKDSMKILGIDKKQKEAK